MGILAEQAWCQSCQFHRDRRQFSAEQLARKPQDRLCKAHEAAQEKRK